MDDNKRVERETGMKITNNDHTITVRTNDDSNMGRAEIFMLAAKLELVDISSEIACAVTVAPPGYSLYVELCNTRDMARALEIVKGLV